MDDNIWEYPFGELDDDDDIFYRKPEPGKITNLKSQTTKVQNAKLKGQK